MSIHNEGLITEASEPKTIVTHFLDARKAFEEMYDEVVDIKDMCYLVSNEVYLRLCLETEARNLPAFINTSPFAIDSFYGISLENSEALHDGECVLLSPDHEYHFEIPKEPEKQKRQPSNTPYTRGWPRPAKPDPAITPLIKEDFDFGIGWLWRTALRLIDWLNHITGADKPKHKNDDSTEQMLTMAELFDSYEDTE